MTEGILADFSNAYGIRSISLRYFNAAGADPGCELGEHHGNMDLVFVDGCHHYEFAKSDSENALKMLSPGGIVIWHDYAPYAPGVVRALEELGARIPLRRISGTSMVVYERKAEGQNP